MRPRILLALLVACGDTVKTDPPPGQIVLYIDTDAPVPIAPDSPDASDAAPPLFDRLRIEIFAPGQTTPCDGCDNAFAVDTDLFRAGKASVGVSPPAGVSGFRARVRLYPAAYTSPAGDPDPGTVIDRVVALPVVAEQGRIDITVMLETDTTGIPGSLDAPSDPIAGAPSSSLVGTWSGAERVPCADAQHKGEVCVPGGAFFIGAEHRTFTAIPGHDGLAPRLVVLSPFWLDATEVTVAQFRKSKPAAADVFSWSGGTTGVAVTDFCNSTAAPGPFESRPVNCMTWRTADAYCRSKGKLLPTEAQIEYVLGGLVSHTFPWGEDPPACEDAVFGRTGYGIFANDSAPCRSAAPPGGTLDVGSAKRDRLALATGTLLDLAGNVAEFAQDTWNYHHERCWSATTVYRDPVCSKQGIEGTAHTVRGGDWVIPGGELARQGRVVAPVKLATPEIGFRCARKAATE
jgi:sulfatase modifying factor 1